MPFVLAESETTVPDHVAAGGEIPGVNWPLTPAALQPGRSGRLLQARDDVILRALVYDEHMSVLIDDQLSLERLNDRHGEYHNKRDPVQEPGAGLMVVARAAVAPLNAIVKKLESRG